MRQRLSTAQWFCIGIALVCGLALLLPATFNPPSARAATVVVDDFSIFQADVEAYPDPDFALPKDDSSTISGSGILGGERDLRAQANIEHIEPSNRGIFAGVDNGQLEASSQTLATGTITVQWDGADGDAVALDPTGLGGVDLTGGGTEDAFFLSVPQDTSDTPGLVITVYTDGANYSNYTLVHDHTTADTNYVVGFNDFTSAGGSGADFTDVGAITLSFDYNGAGGIGPYIDTFQTTRLDSEPPVTTAALSGTLDSSGWYSSPVQVTLNATDNLSGVSSTGYSIDDGPNQTYTAPFTISAEGQYIVEFFSTDQDGNIETPGSIPVNIDQTAPVYTTTITTADGNPFTPGPGVWINQSVTIAFTCAETGTVQSGLAGTFGSSATFENEGQGLESAASDCKDRAGNQAAAASVMDINIDKTGPITAAGGPYVVDEGGSVSLDGSGSTDALSGIAAIVWALDDDGQFNDADPASFSALDGADGTTVSLQVTDLAGNVTTVNTTVTVSNLPPEILSVTNDGPLTSHRTVNVIVNATDPAGLLDPLNYEFDCDGDLSYEIGPQAGNTASCNIGVQEGGIDVNVRVTDDDGGEALGSTVIWAPTEMCVSHYTGQLRYGSNCQSHEIAVVLASEPVSICFNRYTRGLRFLQRGDCSWGETRVTLPEDGPLAVCVSRYTGLMRAIYNVEQCQRGEFGRIIGN